MIAVMNKGICSLRQILTTRPLAMMVLLAGLRIAEAQPTIISTIPTNNATGVSPGAAVVFTFSTNMDPTATSALFSDVTAGLQSPTVIPVWSAGNKVLTCTPSPAFANNHNIQWNAGGQDMMGNSLVGTTTGNFTTVMGVGGGSGTNAVTTFLAGKYAIYHQTSTAPPPFLTYEFFAQTTLTSNRTATNITVTIPITSGISNLVQDSLQPEKYAKRVYNPNLTIFNTNFPAGDYVFNVSATASNQQVTVNLPNYAQPNAPQVSNYTAAQAIDPSQPFTLTWNTFTNGGSTDWILFFIDGAYGTFFQTPDYGQPNALNGNATSVTIPAGTLQASSTNQASLVFYHLTTTTSGGTVTEAFVGTDTGFSISTSAGAAAAPVLTNAVWSAGSFAFDILTTTGQTVTVIYTNNLKSASSTWPILLTTNSPGSKVHISDPHSATSTTLFYRARNGS
jgi:hypothetical protein